MRFKSTIYPTKYGKDFGKTTTFEAKDYKEAIKKLDALDALATHLCHGKKDAISYTKPTTI